jgi:hypothetical protein
MIVLKIIYRWRVSLLIGLFLLLVLLLWLSPGERTLGKIIKLVYLHGALVRTAVIFFAVSLPVNLVGLINSKESWLGWGKALSWTAIGIWLVHTLASMITTYAAWGVFIAWDEPLTRFTFNLAAVGIIVFTVTQLVANPRFSALMFLLLAGVVLALLPGLGIVQHPLDPIGSSNSTTIRVFYAAILGITLAIGGLLVVWLQESISSIQEES